MSLYHKLYHFAMKTHLPIFLHKIGRGSSLQNASKNALKQRNLLSKKDDFECQVNFIVGNSKNAHLFTEMNLFIENA